jgi:hypothetical protein
LSKKKELKRALKDPNTVHQTRLRDGRVVTWKGKDDAPLREAMKASPGYGEPAKPKPKRKKRRVSVRVFLGGAPGMGKRNKR